MGQSDMSDLRKEISVYRMALQESLNIFKGSCKKCKIVSQENCNRCKCKVAREKITDALKQDMPFPDDKKVTTKTLREFQKRIQEIEGRLFYKVTRSELDMVVKTLRKEFKK